MMKALSLASFKTLALAWADLAVASDLELNIAGTTRLVMMAIIPTAMSISTSVNALLALDFTLDVKPRFELSEVMFFIVVLL